MNHETIDILGIHVHAVTMAETLKEAERFVSQDHLTQIATANPEFVMAAQQNQEFKTLLNRVALCLPDGVGLLYAAQRYGRSLPERVPGSELVYHVAELCATHGWRLFLLGAAPGVAAEAADVLAQRYPGLQIVGTYSGSPDPAENDTIVERINTSAADVLYVAYGAPKQDFWIDRNREKLTTVRLAIGIGGSLDFITGRSQRAPSWVQKVGLEWLHRLIKEPWRWRRMMALPRFAWQIIRTPYPSSATEQ